MPRPKKIRRVGNMPQFKYFKPSGVKKGNLEEINLKVEELEAMRLKDIEGMHQIECAKKMNISRQTFQLIIDEARRKVALALIEGKSLHIDGGDYAVDVCQYKCEHCGSKLDLVYGLENNQCPICSEEDLKCIDLDDASREKCCNSPDCC